MLKNHPGGLLVAFFANMGERFGFYTIMAILVPVLQARYDLPAEKAGVSTAGFISAFTPRTRGKYPCRLNKKIQDGDNVRHHYYVLWKSVDGHFRYDIELYGCGPLYNSFW